MSPVSHVGRAYADSRLVVASPTSHILFPRIRRMSIQLRADAVWSTSVGTAP